MCEQDCSGSGCAALTFRGAEGLPSRAHTQPPSPPLTVDKLLTVPFPRDVVAHHQLNTIGAVLPYVADNRVAM